MIFAAEFLAFVATWLSGIGLGVAGTLLALRSRD